MNAWNKRRERERAKKLDCILKNQIVIAVQRETGSKEGNTAMPEQAEGQMEIHNYSGVLPEGEKFIPVFGEWVSVKKKPQDRFEAAGIEK